MEFFSYPINFKKSESLQLNSYLALHSPKTQGIRSKKENLGRADALKAFFWGGGTYYRLV